ncbi:DUF3275 family protein [Neisseria weixii]|uniref:DUF3275 family protein n=1 Tax=Neisseria weixii TaxID=1853276 RepID=UPI000BB9704B|nr:DUF3275 family protein [Neisseria weixii]ATD64974.1 hypothetical protein CGZ65_05885 [Neisseria weixii]
MSVSIPATLNVVEKTGRNGVFMAAELITDIGTFDLKHRVLEQFSQGTYRGMFTIIRIFNQSVSWKNGTWTKLCAELDWEALRILAQSDETVPSTAMAVAEMVAEEEAETVTAQITPPQADAPALFDEDDLVADMAQLQLKVSRAEPVKLDATMEDRNAFRQLRDELKAHGYRFDGRTQSWSLAEQGGV